MSWRRVGVIYLILAALVGYVALFERTAPVSEPTTGPPGPEQSLLGVAPDAVEAVTFQRGSSLVRAALDGGRWRVLEPAGADVPPDLVAAAVATLTGGQASEVMVEAKPEDLATFGLSSPSGAIEVTLRDRPDAPVRVMLGAHNPTKTALYALRAEGSTVYLVGLNLRYYQDLIFEAAGGRVPLERTERGE